MRDQQILVVFVACCLINDVFISCIVCVYRYIGHSTE
jgi:hypothetical protein